MNGEMRGEAGDSRCLVCKGTRKPEDRIQLSGGDWICYGCEGAVWFGSNPHSAEVHANMDRLRERGDHPADMA